MECLQPPARSLACFRLFATSKELSKMNYRTLQKRKRNRSSSEVGHHFVIRINARCSAPLGSKYRRCQDPEERPLNRPPSHRLAGWD
jgi:hypothetical protein